LSPSSSTPRNQCPSRARKEVRRSAQCRHPYHSLPLCRRHPLDCWTCADTTKPTYFQLHKAMTRAMNVKDLAALARKHVYCFMGERFLNEMGVCRRWVRIGPAVDVVDELQFLEAVREARDKWRLSPMPRAYSVVYVFCLCIKPIHPRVESRLLPSAPTVLPAAHVLLAWQPTVALPCFPVLRAASSTSGAYESQLIPRPFALQHPKEASPPRACALAARRP